MYKPPQHNEEETCQQEPAPPFFADVQVTEAGQKGQGCRPVGMRRFLEGIHIDRGTGVPGRDAR